MNLNQSTIHHLQALKKEKENTKSSLQSGIFKFVSIDSKFQLVIDPDDRQAAKEVINGIESLKSEIQDIVAFIEEIQAASETLGYSDFDMARQRFKHIMSQNDIVLKKGIINETLSKEKCMDLEILINDAKSKLKQLELITDPIILKIAPIQVENT